jgi:formylglycine-generating enzyme required for sulfatase activity
LIHRFGPLGADAGVLVERLEEEKDVSVRRALILSLGEFPEQAIPPGQQDLLMEKLREWFRNAPDPGVHAATEWLLRHWQQDPWLKQVEQEWAENGPQREQRLQNVARELAKTKAAAQPQWYVTSQGQTMVVIPGPVEFFMGSPPDEMHARHNSSMLEDEELHRQRIGRTFAIAAKSVTVKQFLQSKKDYNYMREYAPTDDCPMLGRDWYSAAEYCNWLSKKEGLPEKEWCYQANKDGRYAEGMRAASDCLTRTGYRLPTEAEWEYVCRAGAATSRYYGDSDELLGKYAWYVKNCGDRCWPVGSLKPNDLGLFDTHGNAYNWCQDILAPYAAKQGGKSLEDSVAGSIVSEKELRVLRGGGFLSRPGWLRCAYRDGNRPGVQLNNFDFRPARTFP